MFTVLIFSMIIIIRYMKKKFRGGAEQKLKK